MEFTLEAKVQKVVEIKLANCFGAFESVNTII